MHFIWFLLVGALVGLLGRLFHPGRDPMGFLLTMAIGVVSLLVAGTHLERVDRIRHRSGRGDRAGRARRTVVAAATATACSARRGA